MGELDRRDDDGKGPNIQTFGPFEARTSTILKIRDAYALSREPTLELLSQIDAAILQEQKDRFRDAGGIDECPLGLVAIYCGLLMKAYANSGLQDVRAFGKMMRDDVFSIQPPVAAVEIACRRWRQKSKFLPAISEILSEVAAAKNEIETAVNFLDRLPALRARMARELGLN